MTNTIRELILRVLDYVERTPGAHFEIARWRKETVQPDDNQMYFVFYHNNKWQAVFIDRENQKTWSYAADLDEDNLRYLVEQLEGGRMIVFELTMPRNSSWNGEWPGDGDVHIIAMPNRLVPKDRIGKSYYYDFGDGWVACIDVTKMNANSNEYRQMTRKNHGFADMNGWLNQLLKIMKLERGIRKDERLYRSALQQALNADQHRPHIGSAR